MSAPNVIDSVKLWACVDCYQFAAGVLETDATAQIEALQRMRRDNAPHTVALIAGGDHEDWCQLDDGSEECSCDDGGFSWSPCEVCLSTLGGDRYAVTMLLTYGRR